MLIDGEEEFGGSEGEQEAVVVGFPNPEAPADTAVLTFGLELRLITVAAVVLERVGVGGVPTIKGLSAPDPEVDGDDAIIMDCWGGYR
jgi:hypothetical protein